MGNKTDLIKRLCSLGVGVKAFLFANQTIGQTIAKNFFWLGISNIGGRLLRALVLIYAARVLGAAEWGAFSYVMSIVALLTIFTDFGIGPYLTREAVQRGEAVQRKKVLSTSLFVKLGLALVGVLFTIFMVPLFIPIEAAKILLGAASFVLLFDTMRELGSSLARAEQKMEVEAGLQLITNLAIVIFGFALLLNTPTAFSLTASYAIGTGIGMIIMFFVFRNYLRGIFSHFSPNLVKSIFKASWPFALSGLLGSLMLNTDILAIGFFRSAEEVGHYSAGYRIIQILYLFPALLATSSFPIISRFAKAEREKIPPILGRLTAIAFGVALPLAIFGALFAPQLILILFGSEYLPGSSSLRILFLTLLINSPSILLSNTLFAMGRERILTRFAALGGIGNIILDLVLIPAFGIAGSAWATLISQALSTGYLLKKTKEAWHSH